MDTLYESPDEGEDFVGLKEVDLDDEYDLWERKIVNFEAQLDCDRVSLWNVQN